MTINATAPTLVEEPECVRTDDDATDRPVAGQAAVVDDLLEDVSIDGMCGVY
ncbi:MAG: mycofactocin precursor MftA [Intrasporangium sp.]|uniref:mycofactocin precursor MftA n=1 Tax=Intrasporangium sp. TaxID=1925024 RepID=UPI0026489D88|nr:mycofactocin precursor MftA [Intrasporangium sp.]MDN5798301.1 mycofactocin precursor MftA [Intrasporangium sp.]